ncbi:MAG: TetR/AcrR family transcriptional regulator [Acutalibacteraceae bacterium]
MTTTSTVLQIKEATLALSRTVPCTNITVSMVIQKVNIARSTFYKYFQNMTKVWHAITHDLMCSISTQLDQLYISSMHHFNDIQRQKILTLQNSLLYHGNYFSTFFMQTAT